MRVMQLYLLMQLLKPTVSDDDPPTISITSVSGELNGQESDDEGAIFNFVIESSTLIHTPLTIELDVEQTGDYLTIEDNPTATIPANNYSTIYSLASIDDSIQSVDGQVIVSLVASN